jgi:hypothetical protein
VGIGSRVSIVVDSADPDTVVESNESNNESTLPLRAHPASDAASSDARSVHSDRTEGAAMKRRIGIVSIIGLIATGLSTLGVSGEATVSAPVTQIYTFEDPGVETLFVPDGVQTLIVEAYGAEGGSGTGGFPGGRGGGLRGTLSVDPEEQLLIAIGSRGEDASGIVAGDGGFNGGGDGGSTEPAGAAGGGGGGASDVRQFPFGPDDRLVVAAGGGGGGGWLVSGDGVGGHGGVDGTDGIDGFPGARGGVRGGAGGAGGAGTPSGSPGSSIGVGGDGGSGDVMGGGGGGGGANGGGGGGGSDQPLGGGGGGGGSGILPADALDETGARSGDGLVRITIETAETSISSAPKKRTSKRSATFTFSASIPDSMFECSLDGAPFVGCSPGVSYPKLARKKHTFAVRAIAPNGNTDPTPATYGWRVTG